MIGWARTEDGWALNLDGSDAAAQFALPRLELRSGARGWVCVCLLPNGTSRRSTAPAGSVRAAQHALMAEACPLLAPAYAVALGELMST
jgi:hypothetical protein